MHRRKNARQIGFEQDRNAARQADLPAVRMSAQHQVEAGVRGLPVDFGGVRQQDRDLAGWNILSRFFDVVGAIKMRVVHPSEIDRSRAAPYGEAFVEQRANAKRFEVGNHGNRIMVAEHRVDVATQLLTQTRHGFEAGHAIAVGAPAIVARQHTKIIVEVEHEFSGPAHGGAAYVCVQVTQVQNGEAIESTWQIWEANGITLQLHLARVCPAPPIGPRQAKRYLDRRLHQRQVLEMQEAEPLAKSLCLVLALYAQTKLCMQGPKSGLETAKCFVGIE